MKPVSFLCLPAKYLWFVLFALMAASLSSISTAQASREVRIDFDRTEGWRSYWKDSWGNDPTAIRVDDSGLTFTFRGGTQVATCPISSSQVKRDLTLTGLRQVELDVELLEGATQLSFSVADEDNEIFIFAPRDLTPGSQTVTWDMPRDIDKYRGPKSDREVDGRLRLFNLHVIRQGHTDTRLRFEEARLLVAADDAGFDGLNIELVTGEPLNLVRPETLDDTHLRLRNDGDQPARVALELMVRDHPTAGVERTQRSRVDVPAGGERRMTLNPETLGPMGIKYLRWKATVGEQAYAEQTSLAYMDPVGQTPGVSVEPIILGQEGPDLRFTTPIEEVEPIVKANALIGVELLRSGVAWRFIQPREDQPPDFSGVDRTVELAKKHGMGMLLIVSYGGAEWTKTPAQMQQVIADNNRNRQWRYPPRPEAWEKFVRTLAEHYRGRVTYYEIWNEPDLPFFMGTAEQYLELQKIAYRAIKEVNPEAVVTNGGIGTVNHKQHKADLLTLLLEEGGDYFDWFAYHCHNTFANFRREMEQQVAPQLVAAEVDHKAYFFTESSLGRGFAKEMDLAHQLVKRISYGSSLGTKGYFWFTTWVSPRHTTSSAYPYRSFNLDWSPRPSWPAYNTYTRMVRGREFGYALDMGEGRFGYSFYGPGDFTGEHANDQVLVVWTEDQSMADLVGFLNVGQASAAFAVDIWGNRIELPISDGQVVVCIGHQPSYIEVQAAETSLASTSGPLRLEVSPLAELASSLTIVPGREATIDLQLRNPTGQALQVTTDWSADDEVRLRPTGDERLRMTVPPQGERSVTAVARLTDADARFGQTYRAQIEVNLTDRGQRALFDLPLNVGSLIPAGEIDGRRPDLVLNDADQAVNLYPADPTHEFRVWQGPQDLSSNVWLSIDDQGLQVQVHARDDQHHPAPDPEKLWEGDSIQLAFAPLDREDWWELTLGLDRTGSARHAATHFRAPNGGRPNLDPIVRIDRKDDVVRYDVTLPWASLDLTPEQLHTQGLRFNVLQNENDGDGRDGWLELTPGLGRNKSPENFPVLLFAAE